MPAHVHVRRAELLPVVSGGTKRQRRRTGGNPAQRTLADVLQPGCDVGTHRRVPLSQQARLTACRRTLAGTARGRIRMSVPSAAAGPPRAARAPEPGLRLAGLVVSRTSTRAATSRATTVLRAFYVQNDNSE